MDKLIDGNYIPGDIVGVYPTSIMSKIGARLEYALISPPTYLFHFLVIARKCQYEDKEDYEIYESIGKGVAVGRLSMYEDMPYVVFRLNDPVAHIMGKGKEAVELASMFGRHYYDYFLYAKILAGGIKCWIKQILFERRLRRIHFHELPYARNSFFICTELANETWRAVNRPLAPIGTIPIPASFVQAAWDHKLIVIGSNQLIKLQKAIPTWIPNFKKK